MKAMILAAGLGTRLRPLTDERPKALVPVANKPVILWNIEYLKASGATGIIVNAHHHRGQILDYLNGGRPFGMDIDVRVEPEILGTGGGIKNTEDFWDERSFIVLNGDVLTDIPLEPAYEHHRHSGALATLILHDRPPYNKIRVDGTGRITAIPERYGREGLAFTGIHILRPELLDHIPPKRFSDIVDCYRHLLKSGKPLNAYIAQDHYWHDIGHGASYLEANRLLAPRALTLGSRTRMHPSAAYLDWAVIGDGCVLEEQSVVARCVLWKGVRVAHGETVADCVLTPVSRLSIFD